MGSIGIIINIHFDSWINCLWSLGSTTRLSDKPTIIQSTGKEYCCGIREDRAILFVLKNDAIVADKLSLDLPTPHTFFNDNYFIVNLKKLKTELMLYGSGQKLTGNNIVDKNYRWLGIALDRTLNQQTFNFLKLVKSCNS